MGWMVVLAAGYPRLFCRVKLFCNNRVNLTLARVIVWFCLEEVSSCIALCLFLLESLVSPLIAQLLR